MGNPNHILLPIQLRRTHQTPISRNNPLLTDPDTSVTELEKQTPKTNFKKQPKRTAVVKCIDQLLPEKRSLQQALRRGRKQL